VVIEVSITRSAELACCRPKVSPKVENSIRTHLSAGNGILKVAALVGVGSVTVQRVKREMTLICADAA
jgi:hypothetical protein